MHQTVSFRLNPKPFRKPCIACVSHPRPPRPCPADPLRLVHSSASTLASFLIFIQVLSSSQACPYAPPSCPPSQVLAGLVHSHPSGAMSHPHRGTLRLPHRLCPSLNAFAASWPSITVALIELLLYYLVAELEYEFHYDRNLPRVVQ